MLPTENLSFAFQGSPQVITEGLYFGMPEDLYHAIPALSSTGIKNVLISAPDFWANSWMNPFRDEDQEDGDGKEWKVFGKASHTRILEGKKTFDELYCVEFIAPEGCLDTVSDLKKFCAENGIDTKGSSKWSKPDWVNQIKMHFPDTLIYDLEKEKYYQATGGKIQLKQKQMRRLEVAAAMIEKHPEMKDFFTGGYPEVTVIWKVGALWFKARIDYLKPNAFVDLKTFTNDRHRPIDTVLHEIVAGRKYQIQIRLYEEALKKAIDFARLGITTTYSVQRFGPDHDFLKRLATSQGHEAYICFQKKGGAPLARGKKFERGLMMYGAAEAQIHDAIDKYKQYFALYGSDMWVDSTPVTKFEDGKFPVYAMEI